MGVFLRKEESKVWWMDYRDRDGNRQRESTNTDDWEEAQRSLRETVAGPRQQYLAVASQRRADSHSRNGRNTFLEAFSKPPFRAREDASLL